MSAISVILLVSAGTTVALGGLSLYTVRALRGELAALRSELAAGAARVPGARREVSPDDVRTAVVTALAEERERELAEARAYWAEQDARDDEGPGALLAGRGLSYVVADDDEELLDALLERYLLSDSTLPPTIREGSLFLPRQADEGAEDTHEEAGGAPGDAPGGEEDAQADESAALAAARRRHPSHPGFTLSGEPVDRSDAGGRRHRADHGDTADRLTQLAASRVPLADVRPGPLGTLDVFLFADGTTLCLTPSHQEAAERLASALRAGEPPVLMGGSAVSGAYALTFSCGAEENVYLLADRVVASTLPGE
ncbi:hypothetical protein FH609_014440 [Streptomyces sp. 3MP-14]|uniref:Secreted protein n=1 Tax=Streptomyces mimosae TaxID=2586635 RepID=A0A5N5ZUG8_9ACTN|nr:MULTISPECIES: hypothetical protein [Streptomyces]KAB8160167.1 hypothetical protein FH607_027670 [Streptomyces mimosae]KAB8176664.1 hypothetical protein FH609_014440 [Streptomyces sp. 3MP-14]